MPITTDFLPTLFIVKNYAVSWHEDYLELVRDTVLLFESIPGRTDEDEALKELLEQAVETTEHASSSLLQWVDKKVEDGIAAGFYDKEMSTWGGYGDDEGYLTVAPKRKAPSPNRLLDNLKELENAYHRNLLEVVDEYLRCFTGDNDAVREAITDARSSMHNALTCLRLRLPSLRRDRAQAVDEFKERVALTEALRQIPPVSESGLARKRKNEEEHTSRDEVQPESAKRKKSSTIAGLRKPVGLHTHWFYGHKITDEKWKGMGERMKKRWSHVGRIEETDAGMEAPEPCTPCGGHNRTCRVYRDEAVGVYVGTSRGGWRACGNCRANGYECSFANPEYWNRSSEYWNPS